MINMDINLFDPTRSEEKSNKFEDKQREFFDIKILKQFKLVNTFKMWNYSFEIISSYSEKTLWSIFMQLILPDLSQNIKDWRNSYKRRIAFYRKKKMKNTRAYQEGKGIFTLQELAIQITPAQHEEEKGEHIGFTLKKDPDTAKPHIGSAVKSKDESVRNISSNFCWL